MTPTVLAKGHNPAGGAGTSPTVPEQGEQGEDGGQGQPGMFMVMRQLHGQAGKSTRVSGSGSTGSIARDRIGLSWSLAKQPKEDWGIEAELKWAPEPMGVSGGPSWGCSEPLRAISALRVLAA